MTLRSAALRANASWWRLEWSEDFGDEYTFWCEQHAVLWPLYVAWLRSTTPN